MTTPLRRLMPNLDLGARWGATRSVFSCVLALAVLLQSGARAVACSVPVYRYALDRWPADPYELDVSLADAKDPGVARFLRNFTDSTPINLAPVRLPQGGESRLAFPHAEPPTAPAWSGSLQASALTQFTDSPARTEITRRILSGETGVWVLVDGSQSEANERMSATLTKRLRYLEKAAEVPPVDPDDPTSELGPGPALMVKFSVLRVRRDDPAEQLFLRMLAGPKHETPPSDGPWLALVFGRGRVLGAWPADGFGNEQIDEASLFLLGACSCQVKRMNPGWDLLLNANWDEALRAMGFPRAAASIPDATSAAERPAETAGALVEPQQTDPSPRPAAQVETVTFAATAAPLVVAPHAQGAPTAVAAVVLLVLGGVVAWRAFLRHP